MSRHLGHAIEQKVAHYLHSKHGLILIENNYSSCYGEIDLVMRDQDNIVFIEVRYRAQADFGQAIDTIVQRKQKRIYLTALHFIQQHDPHQQFAYRFDLIVLANNHAKDSYHLRWLKNALEFQ